jgi:hypothetical protein
VAHEFREQTSLSKEQEQERICWLADTEVQQKQKVVGFFRFCQEQDGDEDDQDDEDKDEDEDEEDKTTYRERTPKRRRKSLK